MYDRYVPYSQLPSYLKDELQELNRVAKRELATKRDLKEISHTSQLLIYFKCYGNKLQGKDFDLAEDLAQADKHWQAISIEDDYLHQRWIRWVEMRRDLLESHKAYSYLKQLHKLEADKAGPFTLLDWWKTVPTEYSKFNPDRYGRSICGAYRAF